LSHLKISQSKVQCSNIQKYTWTSPDEKVHNQIDHILIDKPKCSSVLDVQSFRVADYNTYHSLMLAKVKEKLVVNKQRSHRFFCGEVQSQGAKLGRC
jgi:hypothetical protein